MPNTYGVQRNPCFCFKKGGRRNSYQGYTAMVQQQDDERILNKQDPIQIENLTKKFGDFKAVDNLSFSIKEGEIFTILGHNGAGKTTAIFMLTGMLTPSNGDA
jgi:ABC-2 type transport system ATP-binding protein